MKWQTQYNRHKVKEESYKDAKSLTVPDQSLSVVQILNRYAKGLPLGAPTRTPIYEGEDDVWEGIDPRKLDISERVEFLEARRQELTEVTGRINERKKAAYEKAVLEEVKRQQDESRSKSNEEKQYPKKTVPPAGAEGEK